MKKETTDNRANERYTLNLQRLKTVIERARKNEKLRVVEILELAEYFLEAGSTPTTSLNCAMRCAFPSIPDTTLEEFGND